MKTDVLALLIISLWAFGVASMLKLSIEKTERYDTLCIEKGGQPIHLREGNKCLKGGKFI